MSLKVVNTLKDMPKQVHTSPIFINIKSAALRQEKTDLFWGNPRIYFENIYQMDGFLKIVQKNYQKGM